MSKRIRNAPPPIVFILLGALGIWGWFKFQPFKLRSPNPQTITSRASNIDSAKLSLEQRFSWGEKMLIAANATVAKKDGIAAYSQGDYGKAVSYWQQSRREYSNDPETLIYLNNALVAQKQRLASKIAVVVPIGSNLDVAQEMLRGVAQAQAEFNQQGGNLLVQIVNDENDTNLARKVAQKLVKDSSILAVVGSNASNASLAGAEIYQQAGVVMITPTSTSEKLSNFGDYIFRAAPTNRAMADTLAEYAVNIAKRKNVAVCFDSQAADNVTFKDSFIPALQAKGGNHIDTQCDFAAPDFNAANSVNQLISSGAEAVLLAPHIDKLNRAIDLARANNWKMALLGTFSLNTSKITQSGQGDLNGVVLPVPFHYQQESAQDFTVEALAIWGKEATLTWRTATSYDATKAIAQGLAISNSRSALKTFLSQQNQSFQGANSQIQFLPSGDRQIETALIKVKANPEQGYYFELVPDSQ
ncbi:MAG: ABC transporter substrate-binding protein [Cyanobacteria bacterium P01_C01_bin.72]